MGNLTHEVLYQAFFYHSLCMCVCARVCMCVCCPVNSSLTVPVDTKAVLSCPPVPLTNAIVTTWEIMLTDKPSCIRAYGREKNETTEVNCTDERITWPYRPDQNAALQIDPVVTPHDGFYRCEVVTPDGNFYHGYHLQVLGKEHSLWCFR